MGDTVNTLWSDVDEPGEDDGSGPSLHDAAPWRAYCTPLPSVLVLYLPTILRPSLFLTIFAFRNTGRAHLTTYNTAPPLQSSALVAHVIPLSITA